MNSQLESLIHEYTPDELYNILNPEDIQDEDYLYEQIEDYLEQNNIPNCGAEATFLFDYIMQYKDE